jgi:hypothetical protein
MWWTAVFVTVALAQTPPPRPPPVPAAATQPRQGSKVHTIAERPPAPNPDPELIGYLGEYEDAADGLDPLGLAEHAPAASPPAAKPKDREP